jgi:hypothetical protein
VTFLDVFMYEDYGGPFQLGFVAIPLAETTIFLIASVYIALFSNNNAVLECSICRSTRVEL